MALETRYDPRLVEEGKYEKWLKNGYFASGDLSKTPFSMVVPPPNVTGKLHLGHAWNCTIQDITARYKRLKGFDVLWLPGMDHAGIATQAKVMERLRKENVDTIHISREEFLKKTWEHKDEYAHEIHNQWEKMGFSFDYEKERFTLDEKLNYAVRTVFVNLYNKGLIYQGERIINWDPVQLTALSNIEVIHKDEEGDFFYFRYDIVGKDDYLIVATTRPETMFGDVSLVVNPKDERFRKYIGEYAINPANGDKLPIIADEYVDIEFGTGVMKCTPAHDANDFVIGQKYHLPFIVCMNKDATMNEVAGKYQGMTRYECRKALTEEIEKKGKLIKIGKITHAVGYSERSNTVVEPYLSKQWFVRMKPLADKALKMEDSENKADFIPKRFESVFRSWMNKVDDWCISRQLWWGHRIPAYYHNETGEVVVSINPPKDMENYHQDEDVLDTWFSSALWPFSTLGWPENTPELARYYPLDVMITAYDIIFFWVSRMIFQGVELTGKMPFKKVVIHGLVRDENGRKMSKSLGNGIDPIDVINKYGIDALRYFVTTNSTPGQDMRYVEEKVEASSNYLNKIWNAARYVYMSLGDDFKSKPIDYDLLDPLDKLILSCLDETIKNVTDNMDDYEFNAASTHLYNFVYDDFCSWYLETSKVALQSDDENKKNNVKQVLFKVLKAIVIMIYPYTPFISEEIYLNSPEHLESIMKEVYPSIDGKDYSMDIKDALTMHSMITDIRNYKVNNKLAPNEKVSLMLHSDNKLYDGFDAVLKRFSFAKDIEYVDSGAITKEKNLFVYDGAKLAIKDSRSKDEILLELNKKIEEVTKEILRGERMLGNKSFLDKAPLELVEKEKTKLDTNKRILAELENNKNNLL